MHRKLFLVAAFALMSSLISASCSKSEAPPPAAKKSTATAEKQPTPSDVPDDPELNRITVSSVSEGIKVTATSGAKVYQGTTPATLWVPDGDYIVHVEDGGNVWDTFLDNVNHDEKLEVPVGGSTTFVVGGRKVPVSLDATVVSVDAEDGLDFRPLAAKAETIEGATAPFRADRNGAHIDSIVVHATMTSGSAKEAFDADAKRELSSHFYIARDGVIYQALDLAATAYHAGAANDRSVGVSFVHPTPNLLNGDKLPEASDWDDANYPTDARKYTVNDAPVKTIGLTAAQQRAWDALLLALLRTFPAIEGRFPHKNGAVELSASPGSLPGIVGHLHVTAERWDLVSFDFERLRKILVAANRWKP